MKKLSIAEHIIMAESLRETHKIAREMAKNPILRDAAEKLSANLTYFRSTMENLMIEEHPEMKPEETLDIYF